MRSFPRAILHIDGDAFFASCEVASRPHLKGKPVVTGAERGIASSMSYEAKRAGVTRGMPIFQIKKVCPDAVILPSDYETYGLYSKRMYEIVRRTTPTVEEYSIDECFAELTGLRRPLRASYEEIARKVKQDLQNELNITFSVGLAPTKVLAKIASKWSKPDGLTVIKGRDIEAYLSRTRTEDVWGIGPETSAHLAHRGVGTALQLVRKDAAWVKKHLTKPHREIWHELQGTSFYAVNTEEKHSYQSISKTKTFTPPSREREFVFAQLSKNIENACIKARRHGLAAREVAFFIKTQNFKYRGVSLKLDTAVNIPTEVIRIAEAHFGRIWLPGVPYRATGAALLRLASDAYIQQDLFGRSAKIKEIEKIFGAVDAIDKKYGKHTLFLGTSFRAVRDPEHRSERGVRAFRKIHLLKGESERKRLDIPLLGDVI